MSKRFSGPPVRRKKADGTLDTKSKRKNKPAPIEKPKIELKPKPEGWVQPPEKPKVELKPIKRDPSKPKPEFKPKRDSFRSKPEFRSGTRDSFRSKPDFKSGKRDSFRSKPDFRSAPRDPFKPVRKLSLAESETTKTEPEAGMPNYVVGRRAAIELLRNQSERNKIEKVYIAHGAAGPQISEILRFVREGKIAQTELDRRRFGELEQNASAGTDSQGIIILLSATTYWELDDLIAEGAKKGRVVLVALDGIEDPHNIGAIIRSAEALGATGILMPKRGAVLTPAVYKTSAGAALHLPIVKIGNLAETLTLLQDDHSFQCIGLAGEAEKEIKDIASEGNICLIIGSEEKGLHLLTRKRCNELVKIPLQGKTESLNASVAAAVAMYQILS